VAIVVTLFRPGTINRTGSLLIAPTAVTHTRRANIPKRGDKYIATSWILFRRDDVMRAP
jgi:hypothetical protein